MKKVFKLSALLLTVVAIMSLTSCGKDDEEKLIGKWNVTSQSGIIEEYYQGQLVGTEDPFEDASFNYFQFNEDGTGVMSVNIYFTNWDDDDDDWNGDGRKSIMFKNHKGDSEFEEFPMPFTWKLTDDHLVLIVDQDDADDAIDFKVEDLTNSKLSVSWKYTEEDGDYSYVEEMKLSMKKA